MSSWTLEGKKARLRKHYVRGGLASDFVERLGVPNADPSFLYAVKISMPLKRTALANDTLKRVRRSSMTNPYWEKLISEVKKSLAPEFEAGRTHTTEKVNELKTEMTAKFAEVNTSLADMHVSLDAISKKLG